MTDYPRDLKGYGRNPPHAQWPGNARIAVQFVVNLEEGGENCILHGDAASEAFLSEIIGAQPWPGQRHMNMESIYEYGTRAGFWRLWRMFTAAGIPVTAFGVATAMMRNPDAVAAMKEAGWEIASHGLKWIDYKDISEADERRDLHETIRLHIEATGSRPLGFYLGRCSEKTTRLVMEEQGFLYTADTYADDLPYWIEGPAGPQLAVPYTLDTNDMRFATAQGFNSGDQFFAYLRDAFDTLYDEGAQAPKMLSIGLHGRLVGRPGRAAAMARFIAHCQARPGVWFATRLDIARHWIRQHPPVGGYRPSRMPRALFVAVFGDIYEHTPQIAEQAHRGGLTAAHDTAQGLHEVMRGTMLAMSREEKRALILAHPDLAGKLAQAKILTADSAKEQGSAGLDQLTTAEVAQFTALNTRYREKFGFPYILAVKGRSKDEILTDFTARIGNDAETEFATALEQITRIALLRLKDRLPQA